jgi:hypothetical protein
MTYLTPRVRSTIDHLVRIDCSANQVSLPSVTVEAFAMAGPINLHLNWYLLITLIAHAEDFLFIFLFGCYEV